MSPSKYSLSFLSLLLVLFICCSKGAFEPLPLNTSSKPSTISQENESNIVSRIDLLRRLDDGCANLKGLFNADYSLSVYTTNADTLLYIVNYREGGWKIFSSDKRTPPILAEAEHGRFSIEDGSPAVSVWLDRMAIDIARVRRSSDEKLAFSAEEIKTNLAFWSGVEPMILQDNEEEPTLRDLPPGHWETETYTVTEVYDSLPHMVPQWSQWMPYNEYCPYYVGTTDRACAGCVAVAGAQVLHYLHYKIGLPSETYSEGYCVGDIDNYYQSFWNTTTTIWASMDTISHAGSNISVAESILIGSVGASVNMHFCYMFNHGFSWAVPSDLTTEVFAPAGIDCVHGNYNEVPVRNNLANRIPVIVSASDMLIPANGNIHCFVIDGYKRSRTKYCHHHYYVLDEPSSPYQLVGMPPKDYTTYTYSSPYITNIKINWGWWTQWGDNPVNDGWYSLTGGWTVTNNGTYDYNYNIKMIYDFTASE